MALVDDIGRASDNHVAVLVGVVSLLVPGTALMAAYFPSSLTDMDFFKIFFLAIVFGTAITTPIFLGLSSRYLGDGTKGANGNNTGVALFVLSTVTSGLISSIVTLIFWLMSIDLGVYLIVHTILFYVLLPAVLICLLHYNKRSGN